MYASLCGWCRCWKKERPQRQDVVADSRVIMAVY